MATHDLAFAVATSSVLATLFYPALRTHHRVRLTILAVLTTSILLTPLLISPGHRLARLLAGILAVAYVCKLHDLHVGAGLGHRPTLRSFVAYLPNLAAIVLRKLDREPSPSRHRNLVRLARSLTVFLMFLAAFLAIYQIDWRPWPLAVEHIAKASAFFLMVFQFGAAGASLLRLAGLRVREPMNAPYLATTPADFWRRYNRPAGQFLYQDVFLRLGGQRRPIVASIATFAVSATLHEYLFDMAVGRFLGYQIAFFMVQGVAVTATMRLRPRGGWAVAGWAATLVFNLGTSILFLASLDEVVPLYKARPSR